MRARLMTMPPAAGNAPPLRPVPAPRLTKGILSRAQMRTTACTCFADAAAAPRRRGSRGSSSGRRTRRSATGSWR